MQIDYTYTVSIFLLTYNQEQFIAQTIESIVGQVADFKYQLVIGEDCSTDDTRNICEHYAKKFGNKIKLLPQLAHNVGLIANYMRTIKECDGEYVAICDGDDFWTDPYKLQKQVDFLKSNLDCTIVYTNYTKLFPDGTSLKMAVGNKRNKSSFEDLLETNFIPSVTAVLSNRQFEQGLPQWIQKYPYGDWPTYLWTIRDGGQVGFLNEDTATYRMDIGTSATIIEVNSSLLTINIGILSDMYLDAAFAHKKHKIRNAIKRRNMDLMTSYNREYKFLKALKQLFHNISQYNNKIMTIKLYAYSLKKFIKKTFK